MAGMLRMTAFSPRGAGGELFAHWRTITYLTSINCFAALFLTGELPPPISAGFFALWIFGFVRRRPLEFWRPWMSNTLTVVVIGALVWNVRGQFFQSLLVLLLYLVIAKSLMLRSPRDFLQTQILSFFILLATSVITVSFYLLIFLILYLVLATMGFIFYALTRPEDRVYQKNAGALPKYAEPLPRRLTILAVRVAMLLGLLTAVFFIVIPHVSVQRVDAPFSSRRATEDSMTGFSDEIEFGEFKTLQPDQRVVLRIEPFWAEGQTQFRPDHLYLRGTPLDFYDEARWRRSKERGAATPMELSKFIPANNSLQRGRNISLRVHQNPDFTKRIFLAPLTMAVDFGQTRQLRVDEPTASVQIASFGDTAENTYTNPISYTLTSNLIEESSGLLNDLISIQKQNKPAFDAWAREHPIPETEDIQSAQDARLEDVEPDDPGAFAIQDAGTSDTLHDTLPYQDERFIMEMYSLIGRPGEVAWLLQGKVLRLDQTEREFNLQLPRSNLMTDIGNLARDIAPGPSEAEIVLQLVQFFHREFQYTLEPETPSGTHPIDAFLFDTRKGHCEYFATALTLMLRARGVPSRVISGFYTTEWNALGGLFIAKQSDAHAWTEVWLDGPGWMTVDPTPAGSAGRGAYGFTEPTLPEIISEYFRIQWQRYVIDYSSSRQIKLFQSMRDLPVLRHLFEFQADWNKSMLEKQLNSQSESGGERTSSQRRRDYLLVIEGLGFILLLFILRKSWTLWKRRRMLANGFTGLDYMDALMRRAMKHGRRRAPHQTVGEFVGSLAPLGWSGDELAWLLSLYHRHRFEGTRPDANERRRAGQILRSLNPPTR